MLNIYSDFSQSALKYLKDTESSIHNIIIMIGDFNIRDCRWNPYYPFHSIYSESLFDIVDSFSLDISNPIENVPTCQTQFILGWKSTEWTWRWVDL